MLVREDSIQSNFVCRLPAQGKSLPLLKRLVLNWSLCTVELKFAQVYTSSLAYQVSKPCQMQLHPARVSVFHRVLWEEKGDFRSLFMLEAE